MPTSVKEFNAAFLALSAKLPADQVLLALKKIALEALSRVVLKTRVRFGLARGGWQVTIGSVASGPTDRLDKLGGVTIAAGGRIIANVQPYDVIHISNLVNYIIWLEIGSRGRPGDHMVSSTINELAQML